MTLLEIVIRETEEALKKQSLDGFFPGGHNGPYSDPETPVRNTAHWLFTLSKLYTLTENSRFKEAAYSAISYLNSDSIRPMGATFFCRKNPEKDFTNGVIGQAWVMEALIAASLAFDREDCYALAEEIYHLHPWIKKFKAWRVVNVDGSYNDYDVTFNHQLWFAAIASELIQTPGARENAKDFISFHIPRMTLYDDGVLYHSNVIENVNFTSGSLEKRLFYYRKMKPFYKKQKDLRKKSSGYHAFNIHALAILKSVFPEHKIWSSGKIKKMISVTRTETFIKEQENNKYSYPYNPTGLELAFGMQEFSESVGEEKITEISKWVHRQIVNTGIDESIMTKNTADKETARARIYELMRIKGLNEVLV